MNLINIDIISNSSRSFRMFIANGWIMVFNATFNNISVISWLSVLLVEETEGPEENHWPDASHWPNL